MIRRWITCWKGSATDESSSTLCLESREGEKKNRRRNRRKRTGIDQAAVWLMIVDYCSQCKIKRKKKNQPKKDGNRMKQSSESWSESQRSKNVKNTAARVWISSDSDYRAEKKGHLMISGQSKTLCYLLCEEPNVLRDRGANISVTMLTRCSYVLIRTKGGCHH